MERMTENKIEQFAIELLERSEKGSVSRLD
jgi:hypothetical protein